MTWLGLDIGSSSIKGAALDPAQLSLGPTARTDCPKPLTGLDPRRFELDPLAVVSAVKIVLDELLEQVDHCEGVVSCTQMQGVVLADSDGQPLTNYLSWRDQRVMDRHPSGEGSYFDILNSRLSDLEIRQLGHECKLGSSVSLLFALAEQKQLPRQAIPLTLGDFVWLRLAHAEPVTEYTNALGALNLDTHQWHGSVFEQLGIADLNWPRLCNPYRANGHLVYDGKRIPTFPSVGDHQCSVAGMLLQPGELSINASTGSQVCRLSTEYVSGDYQVRPYFDMQYLNTLTHLPAGRALNAIVDLLCELAQSQGMRLQDPWPYITQAAAESETDLLADLTFFSGPLGDSGSIRNITTENLNVGSLFRACFQGMANNFRQCALLISPKQDWQNLVLSGGLIQHCDLLRDLIVSQFDGPYRVNTSSEATFLGLLAIALVASGQVNSLAEATNLLGQAVSQ